MYVMIRVVLVVDDEQDILCLLKASLELTADWDIITANSGYEGIIKATTIYPDVIISDVDMPEMTGIEMLRELRKSIPDTDTPAILLTGRSPKDIHLLNCHTLGIKKVIQKPFDPLTLANQVEQAVNVSAA